MQSLTREQVRRVDQIAIDRFHVPGIVLMENASRGVVEAIVADELPHASVVVLCGGGNNGGDGLAIARHLANRGSIVTIGLLTDPDSYKGDAAINWRIVQAMELPTFDGRDPKVLAEQLKSLNPDLIVDAIFGTGLSVPPRPPFDEIADAVNAAGIPVVAVDLPSGLDCDTGNPLGSSVVRATLTVTFVAMKLGLAQVDAQPHAGRIVVSQIGCPAAVTRLAYADDDAA